METNLNLENKTERFTPIVMGQLKGLEEIQNIADMIRGFLLLTEICVMFKGEVYTTDKSVGYIFFYEKETQIGAAPIDDSERDNLMKESKGLSKDNTKYYFNGKILANAVKQTVKLSTIAKPRLYGEKPADKGRERKDRIESAKRPTYDNSQKIKELGNKPSKITDEEISQKKIASLATLTELLKSKTPTNPVQDSAEVKSTSPPPVPTEEKKVAKLKPKKESQEPKPKGDSETTSALMKEKLARLNEMRTKRVTTPYTGKSELIDVPIDNAGFKDQEDQSPKDSS